MGRILSIQVGGNVLVDTYVSDRRYASVLNWRNSD